MEHRDERRMNPAMNRKLLVLLGPVLGLVMFGATVKMASSLMSTRVQGR